MANAKHINVTTLLLGCLALCYTTNAIRCGTPLTTACLGETDKRYDPESSNEAKDQAAVWSKLRGLTREEGQMRVNVVDPFVAPVPAKPDTAVIDIPFIVYGNTTGDGSRQYAIYYTIVPNAPIQRSFRRVQFSTTTYEKDGTLALLPAFSNSIGNQSNAAGPGGFPVDGEQLRSYPVNENTVFISSKISGVVDGINTATMVCLDEFCSQMQSDYSSYRTTTNGTVQRVFVSEVSSTHIESVEEWKNAFLADYDTYNIPQEERFDPLEDVCSQGLCPTEEQWCQTDPNCSESPYQEPPASVKGSVIAGFVIAGFVISFVALFGVHRYLVAQQSKRFRTMFARRIADTIQLRGSVRSLTPDALADEFKRIDAGVQDGRISKEELWDFMSSGKAGELDKKDFDALFAAIDLDKNGTVDFLEFCAFMGKCDQEYRAARTDRGSLVARKSAREIVATSTARRLSIMSGEFATQIEDPGESGEESEVHKKGDAA